MPSLIKYAFFLAADLVIIGSLIHFTFSMCYGSTALEKLATRTMRQETKGGYVYWAVVFLAVGIALYGALIFLFSWMPHRWVAYTEDGDPMWKAETLAGTLTLFGTMAFIQGLTHAHSRILELSESQSREEKAKAFKGLIEGELHLFAELLHYPEMYEAFEQFALRLEHKIDEAERKFEIFPDNARVCRSLLATFRMARGRITSSTLGRSTG